MKRITSKLFSALLCLIVPLVGLFPVASARAADTVHSDSFSGSALQGWYAPQVGRVTGGRYQISGNGKNVVASAANGSYAVQVTTQIERLSSDKGEVYSNGTASVLFGADANANGGYEFGLGVTRTGATYVMVYRADTDAILIKSATGVQNTPLAEETDYVLKALVDGQKAYCYINGQLFYTVEDFVPTGAYGGVSAWNSVARYDDFSVINAGEKKIQSISLHNLPQQVPLAGKTGLQVKVQYTGVWGSEVLQEDAPGVTVTGLDRVGNCTGKVSYGGKSASFSVQVTPAEKDTQLLNENFKNTDNWTITGTSSEEYGFTYQFSVQNGKLGIVYPNIGEYNAAKRTLATLKQDISAADGIQIQSTAVLVSNSQTKNKRECLLDYVFAKQGNDTYSIRLNSEGTATLLKNTATLYTAACDVALGKTIQISVTLQNGYVNCTINGTRVIFQPVAGAKPYAAIQALNGVVEISRYTITSTPEKSKWAATKAYVKDNRGNKVTALSARGLDVTAFALAVTYVDGSTRDLPITEDMLSGYVAGVKTVQKVAVTYGALQAEFTLKYVDYIFMDEFTGGADYRWTLPQTESFTWAAAGNNLVANYLKGGNSSLNTSYSSTAVLTGVNVLDCAVSADVYMSSGNMKKGMYAGVQLRRNGKNWYEYRLKYNGSIFELQLLRFAKEGNETLKVIGQSEICKSTGYKTMGLSQKYNLMLEAVGRQLFCYLDGVLVGIYTDNAQNAVLQAGTPAVKSVNAVVAFDNVCVEPLAPREIVKMSLVGLEDNRLVLYKGFELEPNDLTGEVLYSDGTRIVFTPDYNNLSKYRDFEMGVTDVTLQYEGLQTTLKVEVTTRPDYVAEFEAMANKLTDTSTLQEVQAAEAYFNTLSPWEVEQLPPDVYKKYCDAVARTEKATYAELENSDLLQQETFSIDDLTSSRWDLKYESTVGQWDMRNGYLINEQKRFDLSGSGWVVSNQVYGQIHCISADVMMLYSGVYVAIASNICADGYYYVRLTNKVADEQGRTTYAVQLFKYSGGHIRLAETYTEIHGIEVQEGKWNNLKLFSQDGVLTVYMDGKRILSYNDSDSPYKLTEGRVGFRIAENDGKYDNLRVWGTATDWPETYQKQITPTVYKDDFSDETASNSPSHWIEPNTGDLWRVHNVEGNLAYGTKSTTATYSWLHCFEEDPEVSARFRFGTGNGQVGFLTRMLDATSYLAVGYNIAKQKWFFAATEGADWPLQTVYADEVTPLQAGQWHSIHITAKSGVLQVTVNGQTVLEHQSVECTSFGRVGVFTKGTAFYVDDIEVISPNGTNYNDGVLEYTVDPSVNFGSLEVEQVAENTFVGAVSTHRFISYNNCQTFTRVEDGSYDGIASDGYTSIIKTGEKTYIQVAAKTFECQISTDGMKTWRTISRIMPEAEMYDIYGNFLPLFHVNSLTSATIGGKQRIFLPVAIRRYANDGTSMGHYVRFFYTDDGGYTWQESENDSRTAMPDYSDLAYSTLAEGKIIGCSDGSVRYYQTRNKVGSLLYFESKDGGITWTEYGVVPFMQTPRASFCVAEDPQAPGTYYLAWTNVTPTALGAIYPRTRFSLARTTDGKNWEFITDIDRTTPFSSVYTSNPRQYHDPSMVIDDTYVYVTYGRSTKYKKGATHNAQQAQMVRLEKSKLTARPWDDATLADSNYPMQIEMEQLPQTKFGIADLFHKVGGTVKVTAINGSVTYEDISKYTLLGGEPNMFKLGKVTLQLLSKNYLSTAYEVEIVPNYDVEWTLQGKGSILPEQTRIMEGATQQIQLQPAKGYKVARVTVNGQEKKIRKNILTLADVRENLEITVVFGKKTLWDYWYILLAGLLALGGLVFAGIRFWPAIKQKVKQGGSAE